MARERSQTLKDISILFLFMQLSHYRYGINNTVIANADVVISSCVTWPTSALFFETISRKSTHRCRSPTLIVISWHALIKMKLWRQITKLTKASVICRDV
jgi:hypothetical protein